MVTQSYERQQWANIVGTGLWTLLATGGRPNGCIVTGQQSSTTVTALSGWINTAAHISTELTSLSDYCLWLCWVDEALFVHLPPQLI